MRYAMSLMSIIDLHISNSINLLSSYCQLGIYMKNCMEWVIAEQAIYCLGGTTVPFYDTLGPDTVRFILEHTGLSCVVCSRRELEHLSEAKATGTCPKFHSVILVDGVTPEASALAKKSNLKVVSFAKIEYLGSVIIPNEGHEHTPPDPSDVATFCYTSGTTGNPKGALITHQNIMSAAAGLDDLQVFPTDRHISYLPLPHIFERLVIAQMITNGAAIAFFRGDPTLLIEDIVACRPTIIPVVPRVVNKIHDKIVAGMAAKGGVTEKMFHAALAAKTMGLAQGKLTHALWDRILFNKIKKALGLDCVRVMVSGSAPLSPKVMTFFRCLLGVPVCEGYGQTEGSAAGSLGHPEDMASVGHVGGPHKCVEIVLVDVPEMGYLSTGEKWNECFPRVQNACSSSVFPTVTLNATILDTSHNGEPCQGRGEICVRGPPVFKGYYKDDEKTKETIDDEAWLHSGDVGLWTADGQLKIIDRKKNIFKLAQGGELIVRSTVIATPMCQGSFLLQHTLSFTRICVSRENRKCHQPILTYWTIFRVW
jgi:long-chain acyl-CoA synthetase